MYRKILALTVLTLSASAFAESDSDELLPYMSCFGTLKNVEPGKDLDVRLGAQVESPTHLTSFYYESQLEKQNPAIGEATREDDRFFERKVLLADKNFEPDQESFRGLNRFSFAKWAKLSLYLPKNFGEDFTAKAYVQLTGHGQFGLVELDCEVAAH